MSDSEKKREASEPSGVSPYSSAETVPDLSEPVGDSGKDEQGKTLIANHAETGDDSDGPRKDKPTRKPSSGGKKKVSRIGDFQILRKLGQGGMGRSFSPSRSASTAWWPSRRSPKNSRSEKSR